MNTRPKAYESSALPLSYPAVKWLVLESGEIFSPDWKECPDFFMGPEHFMTTARFPIQKNH